MTGGGPEVRTTEVALRLFYCDALADFGYGAALVVVTFLLLILAVAIASSCN